MYEEEPETEATASPDDGEFSIGDVDQDDLQSYLADEKTWKTKQNRTNQEAAEARQKYDNKLEELIVKAASNGAPPAAPADPNRQILDYAQVMRDIGADDLDAEVTVRQLLHIAEGFSRFGVQNFSKIVGDVGFDDQGNPKVTVAEAYGMAQENREAFKELKGEVEGFFTGMWANELGEKYDFADQADILGAITAADTSDPEYTEKVETAVKEVHDRVAQHVAKGTSAGKATKTRMPRHTGHKSGGKAVTGERELNIYDKRDRREMHRLGTLQVPGE